MWESRVLGEISKSLWEHVVGSTETPFPWPSSSSHQCWRTVRTGGYHARRDRPNVVPGASSRVDGSIRPRWRTWRGDELSGRGERPEHARALTDRDPPIEVVTDGHLQADTAAAAGL